MNNRSGGFCVLLVCGLVGCAPAPVPSGPTQVLLEAEVQVKVDAQGQPLVNASSAPVEAAK